MTSPQVARSQREGRRVAPFVPVDPSFIAKTYTNTIILWWYCNKKGITSKQGRHPFSLLVGCRFNKGLPTPLWMASGEVQITYATFLCYWVTSSFKVTLGPVSLLCLFYVICYLSFEQYKMTPSNIALVHLLVYNPNNLGWSKPQHKSCVGLGMS